MYDAYKWLDLVVTGQRDHLKKLAETPSSPGVLNHSMTSLVLLSSINAVATRSICSNLLELNPDDGESQDNLWLFLNAFSNHVEEVLKEPGTTDVQLIYKGLRQTLEIGYRWLYGEPIPKPEWLEGEEVYQMDLQQEAEPVKH